VAGDLGLTGELLADGLRLPGEEIRQLLGLFSDNRPRLELLA
jgi:hypothetical protein